MTGYGRGASQRGGLAVIVELSAVNRKGLEVSTSLPREWLGMERELSEQVRTQVSRGKVNIILRLETSEATPGLQWDESAVLATMERLKALSENAGVAFQPNTEAILRLIGMMDTAGALPSWEDALPVVNVALTEALEAFSGMRKTEGRALAVDLAARIDTLRIHLKAIAEGVGKTVPRYRELLLERLQKAGLELNLEDERVLKEIALFADRCDVSEELTRLESHLEQFVGELGSTEAVGRKLDFLCQEIFREINTVGSKANLLEVTRSVIEMKNELERMREQVQNVE